ncbi:oxidoreductase [Legionella sp.]|uniref:oxidoreductase n=1 Tax=Legionella sp. TaxID=459 RepID=UPI003CC424BA
MPKGRIRVPDGSNLSDELRDNLKKRFPDYQLEFYSLEPNYPRSFKRRVNALYRAFEFLLDASPPFPLTKETLKAYAAECRAAYNNSNSIEELQNELVYFTDKIINAVGAGWNRLAPEAVELLNEAEQYDLMFKGRVHLATLISMKLSKDDDTEYVLQLEESLPAHYKEIIAELKQIKAEGYPKTPFWFRESASDHFMQGYFCNLTTGILDVIGDFDSFLITWKEIKCQAIKINNDLKNIAHRKSPLPVWFDKLPLHHQEMMRVLATEKVVSIDEKLNQFRLKLIGKKYQNTLNQITKIPQWYWVLSDHQQFFLEKVLKSKTTVEEAVSFISSRHRTLPLPANFASHSLYSVTAKGEFRLLFSPVMRSSHIASREGIKQKWPLAVQRRHVLMNLLKVLEGAGLDQVVLFQTLVSPIPLVSSIIPDFQLNQMARSIIGNETFVQPTVQTNHPLNKAKLVLYTVETDPDVVAFLEVVEPYADSVPGLNKLLENYKNTLQSRRGSATVLELVCGFGRELFLSSLEQIIILQIKGYSYGSCVSGKDRKAISIIHTDAIVLYYLKYGDWPLFEDTATNRANFVSLVTDLYISRHHQEHAGQNAPGSEGIKTPSEYLPADITLEITNRLGYNSLKYDDLLATNNEVRKISKGSVQQGNLTAADSLLCKLIAEQLGEERCTELYNALYLAFNDMSQFATKCWSIGRFFKNSDNPEGILQIKSLMNNPDAGPNNVARIRGIFEIILSRREQDSSRAEATKIIYNLRQLLKPDERNNSFDELFKIKVDECTELFNASKKEHSKSAIQTKISI